MRISNWFIIKTLYVFLLFAILLGLSSIDKDDGYYLNNDGYLFGGFESDLPTSIKIYNYVIKYSDKYEIPRHVAFNLLYRETTYLGPFHYNYNPYRESISGAVGPAQIITSTGSWVYGKKLTKKRLMNDVGLNIKISMMYLNYLYKKYKSWDVVCGYYNTGYPIVNDYAKYCCNNQNYSKKWINVEYMDVKL